MNPAEFRQKKKEDLQQKNATLHLLKGLEKILLDIDKAIAIIRNTENDSDVIPNLCDGFNIDELQAEFVADIKLRNLNKEHILKKTAQIKSLTDEINELESILMSSNKLNRLIIKQLTQIKEKFGKPRKTDIVYEDVEVYDITSEAEEEFTAHCVLTAEGYFKRITLQSLRGNDVQKLKEGDSIVFSQEVSSKSELLFFTDKAQVYKSKTSEFSDSKASILGDYVASKLDFEEAENSVYMVETHDYSGHMVFIFDNGRIARVPLSSYVTKTNRKKLIKAYSEKFTLHTVLFVKEDKDILLESSNGRMLIVNTASIPAKTTKDNGGIAVMTQKKGQRISNVLIYEKGTLESEHRYRTRNLPAAGSKKQTGEAKQEKLEL